MARPRLVGINHVALEVGDIDRALDFYGRIFEITLRGRGARMAFIDMGDMGLDLGKGDAAQAELRAKGLDGT